MTNNQQLVNYITNLTDNLSKLVKYQDLFAQLIKATDEETDELLQIYGIEL